MKRINKDLLGNYETSMVIAIIAYMLALIPAQVVLRLTNAQIVNMKGYSSLYDVYIEISLNAFWSYILPVFLFLVLYLIKYEMSQLRILRMKNIKLIWFRLEKNIAILSLVLSVIITVITSAEGYLLTGSICSWNEHKSKAFLKVCHTILYTPKLWEMLLAYVIGIFAVIYAASLIVSYIWWLSNKNWLGYIISLSIITIENLCDKGYLFHYYSMSNVYFEGIQPLKHIVYPMALCAAISLISALAVKRGSSGVMVGEKHPQPQCLC